MNERTWDYWQDGGRKYSHRCHAIVTRFAPALALIGFFVGLNNSSQAAMPNVRLPDGFTMTEVAGPSLANDIYAMTLGPEGSIIVSGRGYIRILHDDNHDGTADRAIDFDAGPSFGAMGLLWEDDTLYATNDGSLIRYRDRNHDGRADGPAETLFTLSSGGEHGVHGIVRGPDGWLYLAAGDGARASAKTVTSPTSPITSPRGGCVIRLSPDFGRVEIVADGFRNPYDLDYGSGGEFFTYDSDNERCVSLPWYEPTRFYHVVPGGHCGWLSRIPNELWRHPPYFPDVVAPVTTLDRGSPTGVVCYRHLQFPKKYQGSFFALDWTFGRVWHVPLEPEGSTYVSKPELFIEAIGNEGFAPTDAVVDPKTGDLLISVGGRGTKGAVYRIRYDAGVAAAQDVVAVEGLQPSPRDLDGGNSFSLAIARGARSTDPVAFRAALETMTRFVEQVDAPLLDRAVITGLDHPDRLIRQAAAQLESRRRQEKRSSLPDSAIPKSLRTLAHLPSARIAENVCWSRLDESLINDNRTSTSEEDRLSVIRAAQLLVGDIGQPDLRTTVWDGYTIAIARPRNEGDLQKIIELFPAKVPSVDREISRLAAMTQVDHAEFTSRVMQQFSAESDPIDDIHYLIVLARLTSKPSPNDSSIIADVLLSLDGKIKERSRHTDRNFPLRLHELQEGLSLRYAGLNDAILASTHFGGSEDLLWTRGKGFDRKKAAERYLSIVQKDNDFSWSSELVELIALLPDDVAFPLLRMKWDHLGLRDAIVGVLAKHPSADDAAVFVSGLSSSDPATRDRAITALESLPPLSDESLTLQFFKPLAQQSRVKESQAFCQRVVKLLDKHHPEVAAKNNGTVEGWLTWFREKDPVSAKRWESPDGVDRAAWQKRWASIDWTAGTVERGRQVYEKLGCQQCHAGSRAVGPDLAGIAKRFSRDEIFTSVTEPSRDVPDRYRMTRVTTDSGHFYQGVVVYEAIDGAILQLSTLETVRIRPEEVVERSGSSLSLMPSSLLDSVTDQQIADLYMFLQSL